MEWYLTARTIHVTAVVVSISLFILRGVWMLIDSPRLRLTWVRRVAHVVDTILLCSALFLVLALGQYPFVEPWLSAKVLALVVYIVLGSVALRRGRTMRVRAVALLIALLVVGYIVAVAITRSPLPLHG